MNKILSVLFVGLILSSTAMASGPIFLEDNGHHVANLIRTAEVEPSIMPYCGPNDINCNPQIQLDIVFVVDSTGSMHDEIRTIKEEMVNIINNVNQGYPRPDVKVGIVTYRDYESQENGYLTRSSDLTSNLYSSIKFIKNLEAAGGGDYEEAVEAGLNEAINEMNWRSNSERIIILVGDAPARSHPQGNQDYYGNEPEEYSNYNWKDAVYDANKKEIRIFTASGSGMNDEGLRQWQVIARNTGGSFISLTYERRQVDDYFVERAIPREYMVDAREARDYDAKTDSVMTNNFGMFASKATMAVAEDAGVDYSEGGPSLTSITGEIVKENNELKGFFEKIFQGIKFWN
jgi:hypothetical protein